MGCVCIARLKLLTSLATFYSICEKYRKHQKWYKMFAVNCILSKRRKKMGFYFNCIVLVINQEKLHLIGRLCFIEISQRP